jgi:TPR repeat protein
MKDFYIRHAIISLNLAVFWAGGPSGLATEGFTLDTARAAADKGDPQAQFFLARHYADGTGVVKDYAKAATYLHQSADQGYAPAQTGLGSCYAHGHGVKQDYAQAIHWYRKGAAQNDSLAEYCLGFAYANGKGVPKDANQALVWWHKSAEQGQVYAQNSLGQFYLYGEQPGDTNINFAESLKWLNKAADQDFGPSMGTLGYMYQYGVGVKLDFSQALKWNRRAAELGDAAGEDNLGRMYENGEGGLPNDIVEAYKWFWLSQEQGNRAGRHDAMEIEQHQVLTPGQIAEAKRMAAEFHPRVPANPYAAAREGQPESAP